jgi:hypothetical protein
MLDQLGLLSGRLLGTDCGWDPYDVVRWQPGQNGGTASLRLPTQDWPEHILFPYIWMSRGQDRLCLTPTGHSGRQRTRLDSQRTHAKSRYPVVSAGPGAIAFGRTSSRLSAISCLTGSFRRGPHATPRISSFAAGVRSRLQHRTTPGTEVKRAIAMSIIAALWTSSPGGLRVATTFYRLLRRGGLCLRLEAVGPGSLSPNLPLPKASLSTDVTRARSGQVRRMPSPILLGS